MSRSSSIVLAAGVVTMAIFAGACRTPSSSSKSKAPAPTKTAAGAATAAAASTSQQKQKPDAVVRPISSSVGAFMAVADVDQRHVAIVADDEDNAIHVIDIDTKAILTTKKLDGAPGQILVAPNGTLFVAVRGASQIVALRFGEGAKTLRETARHETGDEPFGLALTPNKEMVLVTTIGSSRLEGYGSSNLEPDIVAPLPRDPRSIRMTPDGQRAFISHATGSVLSVVDVRTTVFVPNSSLRTASLDTRERRRDFGMQRVSKMSFEDDGRPLQKPTPPTPDDFLERKSFAPKSKAFVQKGGVQISMKRTATQGFALAMIGDMVYLPETLVMTGDNNQGNPSGYGSVEQSTLGTHVPYVAKVKLEGERIENLEFSGANDRTCWETAATPQAQECLVPRSMVDDGKNMYIACLDSDEVLVVDPKADAEHAPACRSTLKERTRVKVETPTGVAFDSDRNSVLAFSTFSRKLTVAMLGGGAPAVASTEIEIPRSAPLGELVVEGRKLFHRSNDPRIAKNGRACASCHVDGREDGLVWPTPLGKRQTPMLAGRLDGTAPYGWNGEHASLVTHIKSTLKNLEGKGLEDREIQALSEYVVSMRAPPKRSSPRPPETVARGRTIFTSNEAGCSSCHIEDTHFTDYETHALGKPIPGATRYDTPSLAFVGQTAPYFHDGRFKTLEELIDGCDGIMGKTKHLTETDRQDLVSYLRTL